MVNRGIRVIALTGGPGGGKSELLRAIAKHVELGMRVAVTEEAIDAMRFARLGRPKRTGVPLTPDPSPATRERGAARPPLSLRSAEFQCALVAIQAARLD
jgi:hypothetical protein